MAQDIIYVQCQITRAVYDAVETQVNALGGYNKVKVYYSSNDYNSLIYSIPSLDQVSNVIWNKIFTNIHNRGQLINVF